MKMTSQTSKFPRRSTRTTKLAVPSTQAVQKGSRSNASANTRKPAEQRKSPSDSGGIIHRLRVWRQDAWEQNLWSTAAYWGDKILTMGGDMQDCYWQAKIYYATGEFARADCLLTANMDAIETSLRCRYMGALCKIKLGKWDEADMLLRDNQCEKEHVKNENNAIRLEASVYYLRGIIASRLIDMKRAAEYMKQAVKEDPRCMEAFTWLTNNHVMTSQEEEVFVGQLDFRICGEDAEFTKLLYLSSIKKFDEAKISQLETTYNLQQNADVLQRRAEALFERCKYAQCHEITSAIVKENPFNTKVVPIHVSCLSELKLKNDLFYFAHRLVDNFPDRACTWYAVGAYYLMIQKNLEARKYFSKCTQLDGGFAPGWMGFAHSFAAEGETDQAISAYATAAKLFNGMHLPLMYLGMHHALVNNLDIAADYLHLAADMNKTDPMLMNELGVLYQRRRDYEKSINYLQQALELADQSNYSSAQWETTWFNLAQAYRKSNNLEKARECVGKVLELNNKVSEAHALLGYIAHVQDKAEEAVMHYQDALSYAPGDAICEDLLREAMYDVHNTFDDPEWWPKLDESKNVDDPYRLPPGLEEYREFADTPGDRPATQNPNDWDSGNGTQVADHQVYNQKLDSMNETLPPRLPYQHGLGRRASIPSNPTLFSRETPDVRPAFLDYARGFKTALSTPSIDSPASEDMSFGSPSLRYMPGAYPANAPRTGGNQEFSMPTPSNNPEIRRIIPDSLRRIVPPTPSDADVSMDIDMEIDDECL